MSELMPEHEGAQSPEARSQRVVDRGRSRYGSVGVGSVPEPVDPPEEPGRGEGWGSAIGRWVALFFCLLLFVYALITVMDRSEKGPLLSFLVLSPALIADKEIYGFRRSHARSRA